MTINIAIATYDAIVFGCDSLSSIVEQAVLPFRYGQDAFARDAQGNELIDSFGNRVVSVANVQPFVTNVFGGAQKMFLLYEDDDTSVAAVTAGMATLSGVTIASVAARFRKKNSSDGTSFTSVQEVADAFLEYTRAEWERQLDYANAPEEQRPYFPDVQFIAGGYGKDDETSKVFKIYVATRTLEEQFVWQTRSGTCFGGQADFVERLLVGVDQRIINGVNYRLISDMPARGARFASSFAEQLREAGVTIPEGFQFDIPQEFTELPWHDYVANIDFANLPTQYAVDLVELLVNLQSGMQRFANGVATVGGRTHVGVLKRGEKFVMLNEPKLHHNHTGYSHDL